MEKRTITTDYGAYTFVNESYSTRHGFAHRSQLFIDEISWPISTGKCFYLNRTWEYYRYQTSMKTAVHNLIDERKSTLEADFRQLNQVSRMTAKKRAQFDEIVENDETIKEYQALLKELDKAH